MFRSDHASVGGCVDGEIHVRRKREIWPITYGTLNPDLRFSITGDLVKLRRTAVRVGWTPPSGETVLKMALVERWTTSDQYSRYERSGLMTMMILLAVRDDFWLEHGTIRRISRQQAIRRQRRYSAALLLANAQQRISFVYCRYKINKKARAISQRWPRDASYIWVPWKFSRVPEYAHGYFSGNF